MSLYDSKIIWLLKKPINGIPYECNRAIQMITIPILEAIHSLGEEYLTPSSPFKLNVMNEFNPSTIAKWTRRMPSLLLQQSIID